MRQTQVEAHAYRRHLTRLGRGVVPDIPGPLADDGNLHTCSAEFVCLGHVIAGPTVTALGYRQLALAARGQSLDRGVIS